MKHNSLLLILFLIVLVLCASCAPQIYGRTQTRKNRKCGCERLILDHPQEGLYKIRTPNQEKI
ncbi:MAG: hypothetical protein LBU51_00355 [Bacteroidales bacterium]|nr:hypothetical protein [Bacteroidales bacterium]